MPGEVGHLVRPVKWLNNQTSCEIGKGQTPEQQMRLRSQMVRFIESDDDDRVP